ncbi:hypothetical protein Tco_0869213, partial [Tanacetum coccineum]
MTTLAEHIIVAGAENRPLMLEKSMYDSWASRICLFIKGKKHGRMMLDSIDNGPLVYPTIEEDRQTRPKKYFELTEAQQLQDDCDVQATISFFTVFHPMCMHLLTIKRQLRIFVQVNTKFLNALPPEWSKFVTDVKLAKSFYTTKYDQLYAYLSQHERHANEVRIMRERYPVPLALATIQDGRVTVQQVQGRQAQSFASTGNRGIATTTRGNYAASQPRVVKCYNYQGERHMTEDLDAYDSDCDAISLAKAVLMINLSSCNSDVFSE